MIRAEGVSHAYGRTTVVDGVDLAAAPGRVLGLIGPNGSGKTTLLRALYGALTPTAGEVSVESRPVRDLSPREVARRLAVVVQEPGEESALTVAEMVLLGRGPHLATFQRPGPRDHRRAAEALARVGAGHLGERPLAALSGGERQRVLVARAVAQEPDYLLLDEPTNHLDVHAQHEVLSLVRGLGVGAVVVLHDLNLAARYCDDLVLLDHGRVAGRGTPAAVLTPGLVERVYGIGVRRLDLDDGVHLLFHPLAHDRQEEPA